MILWIVVFSAIALATVGFTIQSRIARQCLSVLDSREALSDDEIYRRFYAASGLSKGAVIEVWHEVATVLGVPAERLQPSDRFGKEIGAHWITSEELDALGVVAQERAKRQALTVDLVSVETVDDYVKRLAPRN
jgi:hypothetical protein